MNENILIQDEHTTIETHNGTTFVARKVSGSPHFTIAALVETGAFDDTAPGTAHYFEHLPFGGTKNFGPEKVFQYMQERGGHISAYTGFDRTVYHGKVNKGYEQDAIFAVSDLVCRPNYSAQNVDTERETILDEWAWAEMQPKRKLFWDIIPAIYSGIPSIYGTPEQILQIGLSDLNDFYNANYRADRLLVVMEGDDPTAMLEEAKQKFVLPRGTPRLNRSLLNFESKTVVVPANQPATKAIILFPDLPCTASLRERGAQEVLYEILEGLRGPLMQELRFAKRLTYNIDVFYYAEQCFAARGFEIDCYAPKTKQAIEQAAQIIGDFITHADQELFRNMLANKVREHEVGAIRQPEIGATNIMSAIYDRGVAEGRAAYVDVLKTLTIDDIKNAARNSFLGQVAVAYIGKQQNDFPDHNRVAAIISANATEPTRRPETNQNLANPPTSGTRADYM